jgi:hypothetical protein
MPQKRNPIRQIQSRLWPPDFTASSDVGRPSVSAITSKLLGFFAVKP